MIRANLVVVRKLLKTFEKPYKFFKRNEAPIASNLLFISSDILMHLFGYDSEIYKLNLFHIDKVIGILIEELDKLGYLEETAIAITSDHGNYKAKTVGNLTSFFNENGLNHYHPRKNIKGNMNLACFGSVGFFNFRSKNNSQELSWKHPTLKELETYGPKKINLFHKLFKIKGTRLMYYRDDNNTYKRGKIYLKRRDQKTGKIFSSFIEYRGNGKEYKTKYSIDNSDMDIFNYLKDDIACKLIDNKFHSTQEWLAATYHIDYPMYIDLLPRHFKNPRAADIILSTCGEIVYNINHGKKKSNHLYLHDIGLRKSSIVPLIISGSGEIPKKEISQCKITDIVPTLLKLLGKKPHPSVIGENLI